MGKTVVTDGNGKVVAVEDDGTPELVPPSITALQARLALSSFGKLDAVEAFVAKDRAAQITWEYATVIERNSPLVEGAAAALGMTGEQMDDLFRAAAVL